MPLFLICCGLVNMVIAVFDAHFDPDLYTILWASAGIAEILSGAIMQRRDISAMRKALIELKE